MILSKSFITNLKMWPSSRNSAAKTALKMPCGPDTPTAMTDHNHLHETIEKYLNGQLEGEPAPAALES